MYNFIFYFFHRIQDVGYGNADGSTKKEGTKRWTWQLIGRKRIKIRYNEMCYKIPFITVLHKRWLELPPNAHVVPFDLGLKKSVTNVIVVILQLWLALLQTLTLTYFMWACYPLSCCTPFSHGHLITSFCFSFAQQGLRWIFSLLFPFI